MNAQSFNELKEWRHMSAREFMRNASEVLDRLERGGEPIVVTRHNRRAVVLTPIDDIDLRERLKRPKPVEAEAAPEEVVIPQVTLTDVQRRVLLLIAGASPRGWLVDHLGTNAGEGFSAACWLEIERLVGQRGGRYVTTKGGAALAVKIAADEGG